MRFAPHLKIVFVAFGRARVRCVSNGEIKARHGCVRVWTIATQFTWTTTKRGQRIFLLLATTVNNHTNRWKCFLWHFNQMHSSVETFMCRDFQFRVNTTVMCSNSKWQSVSDVVGTFSERQRRDASSWQEKLFQENYEVEPGLVGETLSPTESICISIMRWHDEKWMTEGSVRNHPLECTSHPFRPEIRPSVGPAPDRNVATGRSKTEKK